MTLPLAADGPGHHLHCGGDPVPRASQHPAVPERGAAGAGFYHCIHFGRHGQLDTHHGAGQSVREAGAEANAVGSVTLGKVVVVD